MAKYDFDQLIPRRGTNSVKWDEEPAADILPMWVADMDFRTAPCVVEALRRRVEHGVYGYATVPESYYGAVTSWFARRHGWAPGADWILPVTGVIPALSAILRALTCPGDRVLVLTPVYNHFFIAIDTEAFMGADAFKKTAGDILRELRGSQKAPGEERIYTAGEKEWDVWQSRKDSGVPINEAVQKEFSAVRDRFQLSYTFPWD